MATERVQRRLAAILAVDMVGYSRLMGADEEGTIARQKVLRSELIDPEIATHGGRIVKTMGDGLLVEFPSVVDAVQCAVAVQEGLSERETDVSEERRIQYRIGINLGDIVIDGDDILGDGVNVAARLEGLAAPGSICISDMVHQGIGGKLDLAFDDLGRQTVKNIAKPIQVWQWRREGALSESGTDFGASAPEQDIRFCTSPDGVRIAYASTGSGPPLVKTANWLNHLEFDWQSPVWRSLLLELSRHHRLIRYDQRGTGLTDWAVEDISFDAWVSDLETVVNAAGLERFSLLGISQGTPVSIAYAVRHPERVSRLILHGGYAKGWLVGESPKAQRHQDATRTLIESGWGQETPAFRQMFTSLFIPDGTPEQIAWFNELERITTSPENAVRIFDVIPKVDISALLPRVSVPTLVIHSRGDAVITHAAGRKMASMIPNAKFVTLESRNHLMLAHEPAFGRFLSEINDFAETA